MKNNNKLSDKLLVNGIRLLALGLFPLIWFLFQAILFRELTEILPRSILVLVAILIGSSFIFLLYFGMNWLIGFAPKIKPKIAIASYIENSGWGGRAAASISSLAIEYYLNKKVNRKWLEEYVLKGEFIDYEEK